jgi:hypothetical protein
LLHIEVNERVEEGDENEEDENSLVHDDVGDDDATLPNAKELEDVLDTENGSLV